MCCFFKFPMFENWMMGKSLTSDTPAPRSSPLPDPGKWCLSVQVAFGVSVPGS